MHSDVFVRHIRGCQKGLSDKDRCLGNKSMARTKTKRACDECAKTKVKCDLQKPCNRCRRKSLKCEKTRNGYEDPYSMYGIQNPYPSSSDIEVENSTPKDNNVIKSADHGYAVAHLEPPLMETIVHISEATHHEQDQTYSQQQQIEQPNTMALTCLPSPPSDNNSDACFNIPHLFTDNFVFPDDEDGVAQEADPASIYFSSVVNLDHFFNPQSQSKLLQGTPLSHSTSNLVEVKSQSGPDILSFYQPSPAYVGNGFSLARLDPLEAKCNQIIELLKRSGTLDSENTTYSYITRHNMVHLCHLYGKHFQHNLPIIHSPTFDMLKSPPILLLAIMLVAACYSKGFIPPAEVTKLAMRLLTAIAAEPVRFCFMYLNGPKPNC